MSEADLAGKLKLVTGVAEAVIVTKDGLILAHELDGDEEKEAAIATFVGNAASKIGGGLALGSLSRGVIEMGTEPPVSMLVLDQPDHYIGLILEAGASPTLIASEAEGVLN